VSGYRFCRTDDMPLLVEAYNRAYAPHQGLAPLDREGLKRWIRGLDLWCSSCMVAMDDQSQPIAVLLGAKRPTQTLVMAVGVHPEHLRRGHGRHLLTSLSAKLAILGPPALVAEVPAGDARALQFFARCGYADEALLRDFVLGAPAVARGGDAGAVVPVSVDDLLAHDALDPATPRSWARAHESLLRRRDELTGLAVISPDRVEAWVLARGRDVMAAGAAGGPGMLAVVVAALAASGEGPLTFARVREDEIPFAWLETAGFRGGADYRRLGATAQAA
jgi:GNAT superfamily N-acetyltransferase